MTRNLSHSLLIAAGLFLPLSAQSLDVPKKDRSVSPEVQKAIDEFNRLKTEARNKDKPAENEVSIVLPPPAPSEGLEEISSSSTTETEQKKPVLITGKPPQTTPETAPPDTAEVPEEIKISETAIAEKATASAPVITSEPGLEIRVESIRRGTGILEPEKINLRASFPAKPLASPPPGWKMDKDDDAPAIKRDVEIQPGTVISLDIKPHVLNPDADGASTFLINEPGFDALEGYTQKQTVSAILERSVLQLDEDAKQLGNALSELQQILSSLPQAESTAAPEPRAIPVPEADQ